MEKRKQTKKRLMVFLTVICIISAYLPNLKAEETSNDFYPGCIFENGDIICTSNGEISEGHYVFAGGSACCGCVTRHNGTLPDKFPDTSVESVIFYLTASRNNSYYTSIKSGPNDLKLILGNSENVATSVELTTTSYDPVQHNWYIQFDFDPPVSVSEGTSWELVDGDENIYSAVWLHASDINQFGLPGTYENSNCQYAETRDHWYSVKFVTISEDDTDDVIPEISIVATNYPIINVCGGIVSVEVTSNSAIEVDVSANFWKDITNVFDYNDETTISFTAAETKTDSFELPFCESEGTVYRVEWFAAYLVGDVEYSISYTDYVITMVNAFDNDTEGYFLIYDSLNDTSSNFDWDNLDQEYKDNAFISEDGELRILMVNYSIHHSPLNVDIEPGKKLSDIDGSKVMDAKDYADTFISVADEADLIGTTAESAAKVNALGVVSSGVDFSYITYRAIQCRETGEECPQSDWERFDMLTTYAIASATLVGAGIVAVGIVVSTPALVTAGGTIIGVAGTVGLAYSATKLVGGLVMDVLENVDLSTEDEPTRVIHTQNAFMQTRPDEYDFSTGFCDVAGSCSGPSVEIFYNEFHEELKDTYDGEYTGGGNCSGVYTIPLTDKNSGEHKGNLMLVDVTGEKGTIPLLVDQGEGFEIIFSGEIPMENQDASYDVSFNPSGQGTMTTTNYGYTGDFTTTTISQAGDSDLDLHIYSDGKHVGMNYETGEVENEIPNAWYSGDTDTGRWVEMVLLPDTVDFYRIVVDGRGAHLSTEDYTVSTKVVKEGVVKDKATGSETINQGSQKSFDVNVVETAGGVNLDTDIGGETDPNQKETPDLSISLIILITFLGIILLKKKKEKF